MAPEPAEAEAVEALLQALDRAWADAPAQRPPAQIAADLHAHGLLAPGGGAWQLLAAPDWWRLLQGVARLSGDAGCLLAAAHLAERSKLGSRDAVALHAWHDQGHWRLSRPLAPRPPARWCWWAQGRLWAVPVECLVEVGLQARECRVGQVQGLRAMRPAERLALRQAGQALRLGLAQGAWDATEAHARARPMFHRRMAELPAIAWRLERARALLQAQAWTPLRLELEQLQGGLGYMNESRGAQALAWLGWSQGAAAPDAG